MIFFRGHPTQTYLFSHASLVNHEFPFDVGNGRIAPVLRMNIEQYTNIKTFVVAVDLTDKVLLIALN